VGGFSTVVEVRKKSTGKIYAMKMIKKEMIEKKDKVKQIMMERRILEIVKCP
jgi:serine/threonine protein kinase